MVLLPTLLFVHGTATAYTYFLRSSGTSLSGAILGGTGSHDLNMPLNGFVECKSVPAKGADPASGAATIELELEYGSCASGTSLGKVLLLLNADGDVELLNHPVGETSKGCKFELVSKKYAHVGSSYHPVTFRNHGTTSIELFLGISNIEFTPISGCAGGTSRTEGEYSGDEEVKNVGGNITVAPTAFKASSSGTVTGIETNAHVFKTLDGNIKCTEVLMSGPALTLQAALTLEASYFGCSGVISGTSATFTVKPTEFTWNADGDVELVKPLVLESSICTVTLSSGQKFNQGEAYVNTASKVEATGDMTSVTYKASGSSCSLNREDGIYEGKEKLERSGGSLQVE